MFLQSGGGLIQLVELEDVEEEKDTFNASRYMDNFHCKYNEKGWFYQL